MNLYFEIDILLKKNKNHVNDVFNPKCVGFRFKVYFLTWVQPVKVNWAHLAWGYHLVFDPIQIVGVSILQDLL